MAFPLRTRLTSSILTGAVIVIGLAGCDNVTWGGSTLALEAPPSRSPEPEAAQAEETPARPSLPRGDLIFFTTINGQMGRLVPVAFVGADSAFAVPTLSTPALGADLRALLQETSEFTLYSQGTRAGTFVASSDVTQEDALCPGLPVIEGTIELRPGVDVTRGFLARARDGARVVPHGNVEPPPPIRSVRASTLDMALEQISERGAVWPPSILGIRRDISLFHHTDSTTGVAATFLYRDQLNTDPAPAGSYSIFVMGEERGEGIAATYSEFQRGSTNGKLAPRFLGQLDWDQDGQQEVVLELLSEGQRTFRVLERDPDAFRSVLATTCGPSEG